MQNGKGERKVQFTCDKKTKCSYPRKQNETLAYDPSGPGGENYERMRVMDNHQMPEN